MVSCLFSKEIVSKTAFYISMACISLVEHIHNMSSNYREGHILLIWTVKVVFQNIDANRVHIEVGEIRKWLASPHQAGKLFLRTLLKKLMKIDFKGLKHFKIIIKRLEKKINEDIRNSPTEFKPYSIRWCLY